MRGVYVDTSVPDSLELRAEVLRLIVPPDSFVTDRTAGWLHGAPMILGPRDHEVAPPLSVYRLPDHGRHRLTMLDSGERTVSAEDLVTVRGITATTPLRTALDLGRLLPRAQALGALDSLLRLGAFSREDLLANVERLARQRGVVQLRRLAPWADAGAASPGESSLRLRWLEAGLPRPELQIPVVVDGRPIFFLDMGLEELLFAAEYDGEEWHSRDGDRAYDEDRRQWLAERRAWRIEVFRSEQVYGRNEIASHQLTRAFHEARRTLGLRSYIL